MGGERLPNEDLGIFSKGDADNILTAVQEWSENRDKYLEKPKLPTTVAYQEGFDKVLRIVRTALGVDVKWGIENISRERIQSVLSGIGTIISPIELGKRTPSPLESAYQKGAEQVLKGLKELFGLSET